MSAGSGRPPRSGGGAPLPPPPPLPHRPLGRTGLEATALGFGAFKIGRAEGIKYPQRYALPGEEEAARVLRGVVELGIGLIDTAPAYGLSEERIGRFLGSASGRSARCTICTKVGESFGPEGSSYDFSPDAVLASARRSAERLGRAPDILLVHSDGRDLERAGDGRLIDALRRIRREGVVRAVGFSGKTAEGNRAALDWAEVVMVEYHLRDQSAAPVLAEAARRGVGVLVKKALDSGRLPADEAIRFVLSNEDVDCVIVGGLDLEHLAQNVRTAAAVRG